MMLWSSYFPDAMPAATKNGFIDEPGSTMSVTARLRYDFAFMKGDQAEMDRLAVHGPARSGAEELLSYHEGSVLAYSGRLQLAKAKATQAITLASQTGGRERAATYETGAAVWAALVGNASDARRGAAAALKLSRSRDVEYGAAFALALVGESSRATALATDLARRFPEDTSARFSYLPAVRALLALNRGDPAHAIELLHISTPYELGEPQSSFIASFGALYPVYVRGKAYLAAHNGAAAAVEFQKILSHRGVTVTDPVGALARVQLGRALAAAGDGRGARAAFEDFLTLWKDADPAIPVFRQARSEFAALRR